MKKYYLEDGSKIVIDPDNPLGKGGEGTVYTLHGDSMILLKVYADRALKRMPNIKEKIKGMVEKKPSLLSYQGLTIIAWPAAVVYNSKKEFVGYLMHRVGAKNNLSHIITPGLQKRKFPDITWKDRVIIAINLALVMDQIHKNDAVIGDINTSDFFVYPGFEIGVVDTDSFQFKSKENTLYHCNVFTPDYTPPEIIKAQKQEKNIERSANNDNYGLAILIFQILMSGVHPFSARIAKTLGFDGNAINYCMENEIFPYSTEKTSIKPPKNAMPLLFLPPHLQEMFESAFKPYDENHQRPTSDEWVSALRQMKDNIRKCRRKKHHYYPKHFRKCPLCEREKTKDYDYLLKRYSTQDSRFVVYKNEKNKDVYVKDTKAVFKTLSGSYVPLKKRGYIAKIYTPSLSAKHDFSDRLNQLVASKHIKKLAPYLLMPQNQLYKDNVLIGIVYKHTAPLYKLDQFLSASRVGKTRITEKTKVLVSKKVIALFKVLEELKKSIEYEQIYIDKSLNLIIPDLELLSFQDTTFPVIRLRPDDYYPQEYYLYHQYKSYKASQVDTAKQQSTITTVNEEPDEQQTDFAFEKSTRDLNDTESKDAAPPKIESFNPTSIQSIRFHLAIILHKIIATSHPFEGVYNQNKKQSSFFIKNNVYLHTQNDSAKDLKNTSRVIEEFPVGLQKRFEEALHTTNPEKIKRPSPAQWKKSLNKYQKSLKQCKENPRHYYIRSFDACPLCFKDTTSSLDEVREFCKNKKKLLLDYVLASNMFFNKLIFVSILFALIILMNTNSTALMTEQFLSIDFISKGNKLLALLQFERITEIISSLYNSLVNIIKTILG